MIMKVTAEAGSFFVDLKMMVKNTIVYDVVQARHMSRVAVDFHEFMYRAACTAVEC